MNIHRPIRTAKIDAGGGANSFVQIATIQGLTRLTDEAALVASEYLVVS